MFIHLINNKDANRGGAQKILALIHGVTGGEVLCLKDSRFNSKPLALLHVYWMTLRKAKRENSIVAHSRMYLPLLSFLHVLGLSTCFYLHASYRRNPWLFKWLRVGRYIAVSHSAKAYLVEQGIPAEKVAVIYNPLLNSAVVSKKRRRVIKAVIKAS